MTAESARKFEALEAQARTLMGVFAKAGYEAVAPAILQPAEIFLDVIGEDLRGRTYVFSDPEGAELCLRPDLTVPTCRLHWERHGRTDAKARYCYNGPAFRFQPTGTVSTRPREFRQCGIESFAETAREAADVATLKIVIEALRSAGLNDFRIRIGDVGIFQALLRSLDISETARARLQAKFWRADAFRAELDQLSTRPGAATDGLPPALVEAIDPSDLAGAEQAVVRHLADTGIELIGWRSAREIAASLVEAVATARTPPLEAETASLIAGFLDVSAPARAAGARLRDLLQGRGINLGAAIETYRNRLQLMAEADINCSEITFEADFGRNIEYYTGFVFEIVAPALGPAVPVAGGGRYDRLMRAIGAPTDVPAVGAMIHTERLLAAVTDAPIEGAQRANGGRP
ncbi:MAG: ATP phosphoribosyltransferase regulatory subunit [Hyphomicrobiaceae bacterium]